jgi:hypothetical protein
MSWAYKVSVAASAKMAESAKDDGKVPNPHKAKSMGEALDG